MPPLADILESRQATLSVDDIVSFALIEDRARRAALKRGDVEAAKAHDTETARLCAMIGRQ